MKLLSLPPVSRGFPDSNSLSKPVPVIDSFYDWSTANAERVNNAYCGQTVDANTGLLVDMKDFFLTVDLVGVVAGGAVVIDKETVQSRSKHEDVPRLRDMQAPRGLLSASEGWILPLREGCIERTRRRWVWLEIR